MEANREESRPSVQPRQPRSSWWQRFLIFCCNDPSQEVGKPESSSMPDNGYYSTI